MAFKENTGKTVGHLINKALFNDEYYTRRNRGIPNMCLLYLHVTPHDKSDI
jgi:hypothetical protein